MEVLGDRLLFVDGDAMALPHSFRSWAIAFFPRSEPTRIATMASHASLAELFAPNGSLYSAGTAARIASDEDMTPMHMTMFGI